METYERSIDDALELTTPFVPVINGAAPGADADILPADVTPKEVEIWGLSVSFAVATVLNLIVKQTAKPDLKLGFNSSNALTANDLFTFSFAVHPDASYNLQIETDGAINYLIGTLSRTGAAH